MVPDSSVLTGCLPALSEAVGSINQSVDDAGFADGMSSIGDDAKPGFGPGTMQVPGARDWANYVVSPLHNHSGDRTNPANILDQIIARAEKGVVHEVVTFNAGERHSKLRIGKLLN